MKIVKNVKLWSLILGATIGTIVWKGIIIDPYSKGNTAELWALWGLTFFIVATLYFKREISTLVDKWE